MQTRPNPRRSRFLAPALLASILAAGATRSTKAQQANPPPGDPLPPLSNAFEPVKVQEVPWLMPSTPTPPDWLNVPYPQSPFQLPGVGTASFGDNPLQSATMMSTRRSSNGTGATLIPLGPLDVSFDATYGMTYGSGLLTGPDRDEASFRHSVTPAVNLFAGDRWSIRYAPSVNFFTAEGYDNTVDHAVRLTGSASTPNWLFGLNHGTSISSTPLIETGRQTDQTLHSTGLNADWDLNGRDSLAFSLAQTIRFADQSPDAFSWVNHNWYQRPLSDRISGAIGAGVGYDYLDPGTDMLYERLNARVQGVLGPKIRYTLSGGAEIRQFSGSGSSSKVSPLASGTITYEILDRTSLFMGYDYSIGTSYFTDQFTQNSSINAGLTQILSTKWSATIGGGFRTTQYQSTLDAEVQSRDDKSTFASCSLSWRPFRRLTTSLSYSFRSNDSDRTDFGFDSHQVGLRMTYGF